MNASRVTRFCPECGAKVQGSREQLATPVNCPKCSRVVLFSDFSREPSPELINAAGLKPVIDFGLGKLLLGIATGLFVLAMIAVVSGAFTAAWLAAVLVATAGLAGVCAYIEQLHRVQLMYESLNNAVNRIEGNYRIQLQVTRQYHGLQGNFDALVSEERQRLEAELARVAEQEASFDARVRREVGRITAAAQAAQADAAIKSEATREMAIRLLDVTEKSIFSKLTPNNYVASKDRFLKTVEFCRKKGYEVTSEVVDAVISQLREDFETVVRRQAEREEQARIKARLREEMRLERELEAERKQAEMEKAAIEKALVEALARTANEHSAEVEGLRARLADAEARAFRAMSMAQQTKAGYVYVISNIGSFGESVFKIGMTRRLEPMDRFKELGDASVPFPFDVHMLISCDDAPSLENGLHRRFHEQRINKVNLRKEFFRVDVEQIRKAVEDLHGEVEYVATHDALEFMQSLTISDEDYEFVSSQTPQDDPDDF